MFFNCSELTTSLKTLKSLQSQLNQQIEEFESVKDNENSNRTDKITMLKEIWQTRKGIKEIVKSDIIFDIDSNWNELDHEQKLTNILQSIESKKPLNKIQLTYLYNLDNDAAFKNQELRRIRESRDKNADMLVIFECQPIQIIHNQKELEKALKDQIEIKAYVGELFPKIFKLLPEDIEHIYTEFPEGKIKQKTIKLGTGLNTSNDFMREFEKKGFRLGPTYKNAKDLMDNSKFIVAEKKTQERLIILSVTSLGFTSEVTVKEVYDRAKKFGLEICSPEVGPQLRLQYPEQPIDENLNIAMDGIDWRSPEDLKVFRLRMESNNSQILSAAGEGRLDGTYGPNTKILVVFARRSKT